MAQKAQRGQSASIPRLKKRRRHNQVRRWSRRRPLAGAGSETEQCPGERSGISEEQWSRARGDSAQRQSVPESGAAAEKIGRTRRRRVTWREEFITRAAVWCDRQRAEPAAYAAFTCTSRPRLSERGDPYRFPQRVPGGLRRGNAATLQRETVCSSFSERGFWVPSQRATSGTRVKLQRFCGLRRNGQEYI